MYFLGRFGWRHADRYTRQERDVTATVGEEFITALEANPTTGHQREPEYDKSLVRLVNHEFSSAGTGIGSGGSESLPLAGARQGNCPYSLHL